MLKDHIRPTKLAAVLGLIQAQICAYASPGRCDCKFGGEKVCSGSESGNGCPEMGTVIDLLDRITDEEMESILKRKSRPVPTEDDQVDKPKERFRNKKKGTTYTVSMYAVDTTNCRDGLHVAVFHPEDNPTRNFVRDIFEFHEKFELIPDGE